MPTRSPSGSVLDALSDQVKPILASATGSAGWLGWNLESVLPPSLKPVEVFGDAQAALDAASRLDNLILVGVMWAPGGTELFGSLAEATGPSCRLFYCEPTQGLGVSAAAQRAGRRFSVATSGFSHHLDVPPVIRAAGMRITTIHRFSIGTPSALRTFVAGEARWYPGLIQEGVVR